MVVYESYWDADGNLVTDEIGETTSSASFYGFPQFRNARECVEAYMDGRISEEEFEHEMEFFEVGEC